MISIEQVPEPGSVDASEGGLIVPVPGTEPDSILLESRDGSEISRLNAQSVRLDSGGKLALRSGDVKIAVYVTDARLAFACSKYEKGGGWYGGATALIVFNAVSKARAAYRRRGKMLVGQARYPWIQRVGSTSRSGMGSEERLVIDARGADGASYRLTLKLPKNLDAALVASTVANRAAAYRLACDPTVDEASNQRLRALAVVGPLPPHATKNNIVFHEFPAAPRIDPTSARFALGKTAGTALGAIPPPPPPPPPVDFAARPATFPPPPPSAPPLTGLPAPATSAPAGGPANGPAPSRLKGKLATQSAKNRPGGT
jgi:hypothetical protein